jgi:phosphoglycolate phosphatase
VKTLIFDFDGTIADSFETLLGTFEEITARPDKLTAREIQSLRGKSLKEVIKYLKIKRWQIPRLILQAKKLLAARIVNVKSFSGMPQALKQLHKTGAQMFILSTNNSKIIHQFLDQNNLDGLFVKVYGDIGLRSKSSALKKIMNKEKIKPSNCVYIGDEVRDVEAAKKAGVMPVAVAWGFNFPNALNQAQPAALAQAPKDLIKILE